jgi:hypothetical protein
MHSSDDEQEAMRNAVKPNGTSAGGWTDGARHGIPDRTARVQARMDRDSVGVIVATLAFAELMAAGGRAARGTGDGGLPAAVAAVRAAVVPLWPRTTPEAARDVLLACADLAFTQHQVVAVPGALGKCLIASEMLSLTAGHAADKRPVPAGHRFTPPEAYASSCAFDRDDDAAVLDAVCVLLALANPAVDAIAPEGGWADDEDWGCPDCGGDDAQHLRVLLLRSVRLLRVRCPRLRLLGMTSTPGFPDVVALVGRGLAVFPLPSGGKAAGPGWQRACTSDLAILARSWPRGANIGVGCRASGVAGLDLDRHPGGPDGVAAFAQLCARLGVTWPATFTVATPSGDCTCTSGCPRT